MRAHHAVEERVHYNRKIEVVWNTVVEEVLGEGTVTAVKTRNVVTNLENTVSLTGCLSMWDSSQLIPGKQPGQGGQRWTYSVNISMETQVAGLFAVGDIRQNSASQLATAVGDGATAAISAFNFVRSKNW